METFDLIIKSKAIIGFNSTTLLEGVIAKKIVISPWFGDLLLNNNWNYFKDFPELINYMNNVADLEKIIFNFNNITNYNDNKRYEFLHSFIWKPDGNASVRAEKEIIELIK